MKRLYVEVAPDKRSAGWKVNVGGTVTGGFATQRAAIAACVGWCREMGKLGKPVTLKIKRPDGRIRDERTYPRSSDPKRSRG